MKNWTLITLLFCCLLIFPCSSCSTTAGTFGLGAASGVASSETLKGLETDLKNKEQEYMTRYAAAIEQLEGTADEAEKKVLQTQIDELEKKILNVQTAEQAVAVAKEAIGTDYSDPAAVGGLGALAISLLMNYMQKSKNKKLVTVLEGVQAGVNKFSALSDPQTASKLYDTIKEKTIKVKANGST